MAPLPSPLRAALGLALTAVDEAKRLPDRAIELPMVAVSKALQFSLRAQQRYAELEARGDQLLAARGITDEPPAWATFDDPVTPADTETAASRDTAADTAANDTVPPARAARARASSTTLADDLAEEMAEELAEELAGQPSGSTSAGNNSAGSTGAAGRPARRPRPTKTVRAPRGSSASAFDRVADPADPLDSPPGE